MVTAQPASPSLNIGLLIGRFPPEYLGGAELQAQQLAKQLAMLGHRVTVFTRRYSQRPYLEEVDGYFIRRRNELAVYGLRMVWDTFPAVWNIATYKPKLDVLLCYQTLNSGLIGAVAQALLRIPFVLAIRGDLEYRIATNSIKRLLIPPIFKQANSIVVQSSRIQDDMYEQLELARREDLVKNVDSKIKVIPNGINLPPTIQYHGQKVVYVGRLIKSKGVADLIAAVKTLPDAELLVVGDGPDRERLEALAQESRVTFVGRVSPVEVIDYLRQARVFVLPSSGEGFPNVVAEAMAAGIPVVATRTAGIPDLVHHDETGYLFETGDVQQMATYIDRLLKDDDLAQTFSRRSLEAIQAYSWTTVAPQVADLLHFTR